MPNTSVSYNNRLVDIFIFSGAAYNGSNPLINLTFGNPSMVTSGVQKAVQRWTTLFLTQAGTVAGDPSYGTAFMTKLSQRQLIDDVSVQNEFAIADRDIRDYLNANITNAPSDEIIASASLLDGWSLTADQLNLKVGLTTQAGNTYTIVLPVPVAII